MLLDPAGPPRRGRKSPIKASTPTPQQGPKRAKMNEKSLQPGGAYDRRLDRSLNHFPIGVPDDKKKTTVCQLHRVANKSVNNSTAIPVGARKDVMICKGCNAAVCLKCWEDFHSLEAFDSGDFCRVLS